MARKRMIDPSFWSDEKLGECSRDERLLFMGLVSNADDEGYGRANPKLLRSSVFPYDDLRVSDLEKWLSRLGGLNLIVLYAVSGQAYYYLPNFTKHQTINKPTESTFPKPEEGEKTPLPYDYGSTTVVLPPKRREEKRIEEKRIPPISPTGDTDPFLAYAGEDKDLLDALMEYEKMRKAMKKPFTGRAKELVGDKLDKLASNREEKIAILNQSIMSNWQGLFPLKGEVKYGQYSGSGGGDAGGSAVTDAGITLKVVEL